MNKPDAQRMTVPRFAAMKAAGRKITVLTAYDYTMAAMLDATGIEAILVGDSMSMVVQGHPNTLAGHARRNDLSRRDGRPRREQRAARRRHAVSELSPGRARKRSKTPVEF